ncbi:MAG TPA: two-component regulator propeller domain-containing protein, partial [Flavisolibacter sp.]|nr:two-component regulator propeller domain-containing protein [Flavisolibacter sp.]
MPPSLRIGLVFLVLSFSTAAVFAQKRLATNQERFGVEQGLAQSLVSDIVQDKDGFLWFATYDGLSRYDGREFKNFVYNSKDSNGLTGNSIYNLMPFGDNQLTLLYDGSRGDDVDMRSTRIRKNPTVEKLRSLPNSFPLFYPRDNTYNGKRWLFLKGGYKGIGWLDATTGIATEASKANGLLSQDTISGLFLTPDNQLFLISEDGVQISNANGKPFSFLPFATGVRRVQLRDIRDHRINIPAAMLLPQNRLAVLQNDSIQVLDLTRREARGYALPKAVRTDVPDYCAKLKTDYAGRLYFQHRGRIFRMEEEGKFELLWENQQIAGLPITSFYIDRTEVLWVSISAQGLLKIDLRALPFFSYAYNKNFVYDMLNQAGIPVDWARDVQPYQFRFAYDANNVVYLSCNHLDNSNVYRWDQKSFTTMQVSALPTIFWALAATPAGGIKVFEDQHLWVYHFGADGSRQRSALKPAAFKDVTVTDARYAGGFYWLATASHGLFQLKGDSVVGIYGGPQGGVVMTKELTEICPDPTDPNKLWIGSRGGGLISWHTTKGFQRIYTTQDGLPNNTVYCMLPDKKGNLWCSTNKGIFRFNLKTVSITSFEKSDG